MGSLSGLGYKTGKICRPQIESVRTFSSSAAAADQHLFDEARVVAKLENHHVVRIYELGEVGQVLYLCHVEYFARYLRQRPAPEAGAAP